MPLRQNWFRLLLSLAMLGEVCHAAELTSTRPEMKKKIEGLKNRTARIPLPAPTEEEIASGKMLVNNGRLRSIYLPPTWQSFLVPGWGSGSRRPSGGTASMLKAMEADPSYPFKTRLFWIVSRTNDCQYCLGHQELKLRRVGMSDDQLASLDSQWDQFPENEQAAFRATRKLTLTPQQFGERDIADLKKYYSDREIIDIIYTVSRYNAVNRWTASTGIPQDRSFGGDEHSELDTPTSPKFANVVSKVIPSDAKPRPSWDARDQFEATQQKARARTALVELPTPEAARKVLEKECPGVTPPAWFQAISGLPVALDVWYQRLAMARDGKSAPELRVLIAWVTARENRAAYSAGQARTRYLANGGDETVLYSFEDLERSASPANAEALRFARKLTDLPHEIEDADIARLKQHFSDYEVAEIIQVTCDANAFDRFTEALQLRLEQ